MNIDVRLIKLTTLKAKYVSASELYSNEAADVDRTTEAGQLEYERLMGKAWGMYEAAVELGNTILDLRKLINDQQQ